MLSYETQDEFFELLCAGFPIQRASWLVGVSKEAGQAWWRKSGLMELRVVTGPVGGLAGDAAVSCPGREDGRPRVRRALTCEDRAVIAFGLRRELPLREIARLIGRDAGVISREVARNKGADGSYWAPVAHRKAHEARRRPKVRKLLRSPALCTRIAQWMDEGWSPQLIASMLKQAHPLGTSEDREQRVSHETIYEALYVQCRGGLRADLNQKLSLKRRQRKSRTTPRVSVSPYKDAFKISERPAEVEDRAVPGNWEGDLILGTANGSAIGTLVERTTRFTILLHLPGRHDANSVADAMIREMGKLPEHLRRSITWDRGTELAEYARVQMDLKAPVFFCDPHSPWQRGTNENTNRLLRFWFEKGTDLSVHTAEDLHRVAATLNRRPRPTLDLQTPAERLNALLLNPAA